MKAVVLEIKGRKAAVLSKDGVVSEVPDKNYAIGEEINMDEKKKFNFGRNWTTAIAGMAAAFLVLIGGGAVAYGTPVSYVTMDVNPSIQYTLNIFNDVIEAEALNEDAESVIPEIEWKFQDIEDVIEQTIDALDDEGYLDKSNWDENGIVISVNARSEERSDRLVSALTDELQAIIFEEDDDSSNDDEELGENVQVIGIGEERVLKAAELSEDLGYKVTPGKLNLVEKLSASYVAAGKDALDPDLDIDDPEGIKYWLNQPVKSIMAEINSTKATLRTGEEDDDDAVTDDEDGDDDEDLGNGKALGKDKDDNGICDKCTNGCDCEYDQCAREGCLDCDDDCKCAQTDDEAVVDDDDDDEDLGNGKPIGKDKDDNGICDKCTNGCDCTYDQCEREECPYCDLGCKCLLGDDDDAITDDDDVDDDDDDDDDDEELED